MKMKSMLMETRLEKSVMTAAVAEMRRVEWTGSRSWGARA
jgi:hypothetical protein